ncbi:MAG: RluA family pseudouridine synthase [Planctomycetaceae bacterium]|jgi:RluA family pseudouridine synthase|nr:RluA family pseudouridine synthase [Planctomycetaceae bacterium]
MIEILFESGLMLAVNKPAGLLTQAARGIDSLELRVKSYLAGVGDSVDVGVNVDCNDESIFRYYLGVPHRLDRPVSGVILFGKTSRATRQLSEQFENRQIDKTYWCVVSGKMEVGGSGTWIDYMRKIPNHPVAEIVQPINPDAREAILHYKVLQQFEFNNMPLTHLEIKLETGRMHQIRLQTATRGFPIIGDATYNSTIPFGENFDNERCREIALHARSITFIDPSNKKQINIIAPIPKLWNTIGNYF